MTDFKGFSSDETFTPLPDSFFLRLLNEIREPDELKVTLYLLWRLTNMEGAFHTLCRSEMLEDEAFISGLGEAGLDSGLWRRPCDAAACCGWEAPMAAGTC